MNPRYDLLVFDLDGTLVETREDIAKSINAALRQSGLPEHPMDKIVRFVGDGASKLVERAAGAGQTNTIRETVLDDFLQHYGSHCTDLCHCYPDVPDVLEQLSSLPLGVLTNKPLEPSMKILKSLGIEKYFSSVIGGDSEFGRKPDTAGILSLMESAKATPARTLLVGDTSVDVLTARQAGCDIAGVQYGFRPEDFPANPPDYLLDTFKQLLSIL